MADNYGYDKNVNLIKVEAEKIGNINWTVYAKIKDITKTNGDNFTDTYDPSGKRIRVLLYVVSN